MQNIFFKRLLAITVFFFAGSVWLFIYHHKKTITNTKTLHVSAEQEKTAKQLFYKQMQYNPEQAALNYTEKNFSETDDLDIAAQSYIAVDTKTGTVILAKNADAVIPPASLTKLAAIYTMMQDGNLEKIITPPEQSYARFLPPLSSAMGLDKNQRLSISELILGMSVCSGNDAALAAAIINGGSVEKFTGKMNNHIKSLGLKNTYFEEPTGLSKNNRTTAKEFAAFSFNYLQKYPENIKKFHSVKSITYPKQQNLTVKNNKKYAVTRHSTNTLLEKIDGCNGLKTGFIYESGFNIALTVQRPEGQYLLVILGGEGRSFYEGISIREENCKKIINYAFENFTAIDIQEEIQKTIDSKKITVIGSNLKSKECAVKAVAAPLDFSENSITVNKNEIDNIEKIITLPSFVKAPLLAGTQIGSIEYRVKKTGTILKTIPLIIPVTVEKGNWLRREIEILLFSKLL